MFEEPVPVWKQAIRGILLFLFLIWLASRCTPAPRPDPAGYIDDQYYFSDM